MRYHSQIFTRKSARADRGVDPHKKTVRMSVQTGPWPMSIATPPTHPPQADRGVDPHKKIVRMSVQTGPWPVSIATPPTRPPRADHGVDPHNPGQLQCTPVTSQFVTARPCELAVGQLGVERPAQTNSNVVCSQVSMIVRTSIRNVQSTTCMVQINLLLWGIYVGECPLFADFVVQFITMNALVSTPMF